MVRKEEVSMQANYGIGRCSAAVLSKSALLNNVSVIKRYAPGSGMVAMIKANGYGHGIRQTARRLDGMVDYLGVVSLDEACVVVDQGVKTPMLLIEGPQTQEEMHELLRRNIAFVLHNAEQLEWLERSEYVSASIWLMVDTGMGHLGFSMNEFDRVVARLRACRRLAQTVLMSHFSCADEKDHCMNQQQQNLFHDLAARWKGKSSWCNSAALFRFADCHYDFVRPGIALYGALRSVVPALKPVMTLKSKVIATRWLEKNASVGYGSLHRCERKTHVAVVAMGYGDGYPLNVENGLPVLIHGERYTSLGKIAMDRLVVDITNAASRILPGDEVVLWGEGLEVEEIALRSGRSAYELLCGIQNRVRFYWDDNER